VALMNLMQMEAFRTLITAGSVTAAARKLRLSQPTVSKLIAQLEHETNLTLFERRRRRLIATRQALTLLKNVELALGAVEEVRRSVSDLTFNHGGALRLACIPSIGAAFIPAAIARFQDKYRSLRPTLIVRTAAHVIEAVAGQQADIGLVSQDVSQPGILSTIFQERPGAICAIPRGHKLARKATIQPKDFVGQPFISLGRDNAFRRLVDRAFFEANVERQVVVETTHVATAFALVSEKVGLTVVDPYTAFSCHQRNDVVLRPLHPEVKFTVSLLRPSHAPTPLVVDTFLAHLKNEQQAMAAFLETKMKVARTSAAAKAIPR
jgi:DNA-binding transcriptional LysR family regulator